MSSGKEKALIEERAMVPISSQLRTGYFALGGMLLILLVTAKFLTPNPSGIGTHQQLGLPACAFRSIVGVRCPSCGMTTAWAYMLSGDFTKSLESNLAGALLCIHAILVSFFLIVFTITGKGFRGHYFGNINTAFFVSEGVLALTCWIWSLISEI